MTLDRYIGSARSYRRGIFWVVRWTEYGYRDGWRRTWPRERRFLFRHRADDFQSVLNAEMMEEQP